MHMHHRYQKACYHFGYQTITIIVTSVLLERVLHVSSTEAPASTSPSSVSSHATVIGLLQYLQVQALQRDPM